MNKILIIDATGRTNKQSKTKFLSEKLIGSLDLSNNEVTRLDLYSMKLPYVNEEILQSRRTNIFKTDDQIIANDIVNQFEASDIAIYIYPVWNWSIPGILKTYVDLIMISKRNFTYKGLKIVGLLENKKAIFINTGGGPLYGSLACKLFNLANPNLYMKQLMNTLGIKDTKTICVGAMSYKFKNKEKNLNFDFEKYQEHVENLIKKRGLEIQEFLNETKNFKEKDGKF